MKTIIPRPPLNEELTQKDIEKLAPILKSWTFKQKGLYNLSDQEITKLLVLEINYKGRISIIDRLIGQLTRRHKKLVYDAAHEALTRRPFSLNTPIAKIIDAT